MTGQPVVIRVRVWGGLLYAAQRLMDAPGQGVGGGRELPLVLSLFPGDPSQFDPLANLSQDAVGVVVVSGGRRQRALVDLPQVEAASLQGGQHLVHGRAHCIQEEERETNCDWLL